MPHLPGIGAITGIVSENGVAKAGGRVGLYDRSTQQLVQKTVADSLGGYLFTGLNQTTNDYLVMALDDDGSPPKNALVQDYITPFPANMGATFPGNWYRLAMQFDPIALWVPQFSTSGVAQVTAPSTGQFSPSGNYLANQTSITAGAPQIPTITLQTAYVLSGTRGRVGTNGVASPPYWSVEFVLNTSASGAVTGMGAGPPGSTTCYLMHLVQWERTGKILRLGLANAAPSNTTTPYNLFYATQYTYTNSGLSDAPHHFVVTISPGVQAKFYLDGALVQTTSLVGGYVPVLPYGFYQSFSIGGLITSSGVTLPPGGSFTSGPAAWYPVLFSATDVTALYNSLMVGTSPVVSAYARDVMTDAPGVYIRTEAPTAVTETEWLSRGAIGYYGTVTVQNASPVTGGYMTYFNGGVLWGKGYGGSLDTYQNTIEFWMKPNSATPASTGTLVCGRLNDDVTAWYDVSHNITTGKIGLVLRLVGGTNETITFNYAPPAATNTLIAITIDKIGSAAKIYANGVLQDTQTLNPTLLFAYALYADTYNVDGTAYSSRWLMIGGKRTQGGTNSSPFFGYLSEIAIYTHLVGVDRLLSHYDSRTLV